MDHEVRAERLVRAQGLQAIPPTGPDRLVPLLLCISFFDRSTVQGIRLARPRPASVPSYGKALTLTLQNRKLNGGRKSEK
jgi:hypothetical protein